MSILSQPLAVLLALVGVMAVWVAIGRVARSMIAPRDPIERAFLREVWVCENGHELGVARPPSDRPCPYCIQAGLIRHKCWDGETHLFRWNKVQRDYQCVHCKTFFIDNTTWDPRPPELAHRDLTLDPETRKALIKDVIAAFPEKRHDDILKSVVTSDPNSIHPEIEKHYRIALALKAPDIFQNYRSNRGHLRITIAVGLLLLIISILLRTTPTASSFSHPSHNFDALFNLFQLFLTTFIFFIIGYGVLRQIHIPKLNNLNIDPNLVIAVPVFSLASIGAMLLIMRTSNTSLTFNSVLPTILLNIPSISAMILYFTKPSFELIKRYAEKATSFKRYETGLKVLLAQIPRDSSLFMDTLVYEHRLIENIFLTRAYGDNENRRAERAEVVARLNDISLSIMGVSFNDLCRSRRITGQQTASPARSQGQ